MNDRLKPPTIVIAVCSSVMGLFALAGCLFMMKSGGPDFLALISIVANVGLIGLAVLRWVLYFLAYVDFRIEQLRQESSSND
jgi:hypothetical protein